MRKLTKRTALFVKNKKKFCKPNSSQIIPAFEIRQSYFSENEIRTGYENAPGAVTTRMEMFGYIF